MNLPNWLLRVAGLATPKRRRRVSQIRSSERFEVRALLSAFVVNSPLDQPDANPGDGIAATASGETTLRAAVQEANAAPGADSIILPAGFFQLSLLGPSDHSAASGHLEVTDDLTITGDGQNVTFIDASQIDSAFHIQAGISLTLDNLTLQVPAEAGTGIVNDGGSLTLEEASIDELPPLSIPAINRADVTTNARHADLLVGLYNPVISRDEPLDPIFAPPPIFVSLLNNTKPDATIAIGTDRSSGLLTAEGEATPRAVPEDSPAEQLKPPVRVADQNPEVPDKATQRRRAVVNSLFQDRPESTQQTVKPVAGEQPEDSVAEPRRLHEKFPMLLPMKDDGTLEIVPEDSAIGVPLPPPLPEPAQLKAADQHSRRASGQASPAQALMAGVLLTMVGPKAFRRAVRRFTGWKNLV